MGLLRYTTDHFDRLVNKPHGLLNKAIEIHEHDNKQDLLYATRYFLQFHNLIESTSFSKVGILIPQRNIYTMFFSHGFDFQTIEQSISSIDFWEGTLTDADWQSVSGDSLVSYYQLFSENDKNSISNLYLKRFTTPGNLTCIVILDSNDSEKTHLSIFADTLNSFLPVIDEVVKEFPIGQFGIPNDTENEIITLTENGINNIGNASLLIISIDHIISNLSDKLTPPDKFAIYTEIFRRIHESINKGDICFANKKREIRLVIFSPDNIYEKVLEHKLQDMLSQFLGQKTSKELTVFNVGCCKKNNGIIEFIFQDE